MTDTLKILIIEDNESDADLLKRELKKSALDFVSETVQNRADFEQSLAEFSPDIILSDYSLPSFDAVTAFRIKQVKYAHLPFIIVSGIIGEENAVELIKSGVTDYVSKSKLFTLPTKIARALDDVTSKKEKKRIDEQLRVQSAELILANEQIKSINRDLEARVAHRTKALKESEYRFRNMMETIPQITWTNTISGNIIYCNQRWYDYTGLDHIQTKLKGFSCIIHPDDLKDSLNQFNRIRKTNTGLEFQTRVKRDDGLYRWHLVRLMPITDEVGQMHFWVGTATDIQELRVLQQQKDDFISIASHELRTPLTGLKAYLQLLDRLKDTPSSPMLPKLIGQANKSMEKVIVLIDELLNASMANTGQLEINPQKMQLFDVINDGCEDVRMVGSHNIIIEGDSLIEVYADAVKIGQVVINFINNAIKYAADSKDITVSITTQKKMVKVSVTDKGPGIEPEKLRFLFDRYYRIEHNGTQYTGLGLGLFICAEIINKHHGQIGADSTVGFGSSFWFTLPIV